MMSGGNLIVRVFNRTQECSEVTNNYTKKKECE